MEHKVDAGEMRHIKVVEMFRSWIANYDKVMSKKQRAHMIDFFRSLFGKELDEWLTVRKLLPNTAPT